MQHPFPEMYVAQKLADIKREVEQDRLVREANRKNSSLQGWVANQMHDLSLWMIRTGERIHERYHTTHFQHLHHRSTQAR